MSFGERLRELREENGMTQEDLGKLLGVSGRQAGNYEANNQFIRDEESLLKIIKCFNVNADYLFGLSNDRNYDQLFSILKDYKNLSTSNKDAVQDYIRYLMSK